MTSDLRFMLTREYLAHGIKHSKPLPMLWDWWPYWLRSYWLFRNDIRLSRKDTIKAIIADYRSTR